MRKPHRLQAAQRARDVLQLAQPDQPYPWHLAPQAVDGSYSPQLNAVCFPAGILQAPAFSLSADTAVNFGAIGAVLGHEMGHGFDDQGSHFDDEGNLPLSDERRRSSRNMTATNRFPG